MWPISGYARQALAQSHTMASKLVVLHGGQEVYTLVPYDGTVNAQAGRSVMRNLGCTVIDPTGQLSGSEVDDLLSPYDCEVAPYRGVQTAFGIEYTPLGVFGLTDRNVLGDGRVELGGQDRAMIYQGGMTGQLSIDANTPLELAIWQLLAARNPHVMIHTQFSGVLVGPLLYTADINVWSEAQKLAQSIGSWLWHDRTGGLHMASLTPTSGVIVASYAEGDGLLLDVQRKEDSDTISNAVVVQSTNNSTGVVITSTAEDTDPTSPTYVLGKYGRRVTVIKNDNVTTQAQADMIAAIQLIIELGRSETVTASVVCNSALDPLDMVCVHRPIVGLVQRTLVIEQIDTPLTAANPSSIQFRKYVLAEDGQTIDTLLTVQ